MKPKKLFLVLSLAFTPVLTHAAGPVFGHGQSAATDAREAGAEAARKAKADLGGEAAKAVIVFAARPQLDPRLVEGIGTVFEKALVYGCEGYSSLTPEGNFSQAGHSIPAGVSVMAIGGEIGVTAFSAEVAKPADKADRARVYKENGKAIGEGLKTAYTGAGKGKLILTFGNQHVGDNQPYVEGVAEVLGKDLKMVGAAAGGAAEKEIVRGEIVKGNNVALLLTGNFKVKTALAKGEEVQTADQVFKSVLGAGGEKMVFVFDCGGRRGNMIKAGTLLKEWEAMKTNAGSVPFFGFYGGGEIGHEGQDTPCIGVGVHVATAALIPE